MLHPSQMNPPPIPVAPPPPNSPMRVFWVVFGVVCSLTIGAVFVAFLIYAGVRDAQVNRPERAVKAAESRTAVATSLYQGSHWNGPPGWIPLPSNQHERIIPGTNHRFAVVVESMYEVEQGPGKIVRIEWISLGTDSAGKEYYLLENTSIFQREFFGRSFSHNRIVSVVDPSVRTLPFHPALGPASGTASEVWAPAERHIVLKNGMTEWEVYRGSSSDNGLPESATWDEARSVTRSGNQPSYRELALQLRELLGLDWDEAMPIERD